MRLLAFLSLVVLLGVSVWLILSPPQDDLIGNGHASEPAEIEKPEVEEITDLSEEDLPQPEEVGALQRTDLDPTALGGKDPNVQYAEPATEGITVTVVDADGGEALPLAEVMVLDMGVVDESTLQMQMMQQPDFESLFEDFGVIYRTNKEAKVMIPYPEGNFLLAGRTNTHFDFTLSADTVDDQLELVIKRVALLRIHVVDERGVAVEGAPVGLRMKEDMFQQDMMRNYTNEKGWTNLRLFQLLLDRVEAGTTYAAIMGLFKEPVEKAVDLRDLPEDGVQLVMPDAGSMTVTVVDQEGNPVEEYVGVLLNIIDPNAAPQEDEMFEQQDFVDTTQSGRLTIPRIGFDLNIEVKATTMNEILSGTVTIEGPTRSHPHVDVEVQIGMEAAVIRGRLVNSEGKPGPNITLRSRMKEEYENGSSSTGGSVRTDEEGYFQIKLDQAELQAGATRTLTLVMKATRKKPERDVVVDLSRNFPPGVTDLGNVMVTTPPLAASGTVLKPDGTPLREAEVRLERHRTYGTDPDDFHWDSIFESRVHTDKDGHFSMAGRFEPGQYRLQVSSSRYPNVHQPVRLGEEGLEITMVAGGGLTGVLLLDKEIPRREISLRLERHMDGVTDSDMVSSFGINVETSGKFQHRGLTPGTYDLVLSCDDSDEEFFRQDNIIINLSDDGESTDVGQIDLRGQLRTFRLDFRDEEGQIVQPVRVMIGDPNHYSWAWNGKWQVVTAKPGLDLDLTADGFRKMQLKGVSEDTEVTFQAGIKVRLRVTNPDAVPAGYSITLSLRPADPHSRSSFMFHNHLGLDGNHEQLVYAMEAGAYVVEAQLSQDVGDHADIWWGVSQPGSSTPIQVEDLGGEQFFDIELNADSIERLVKQMEGSD